MFALVVTAAQARAALTAHRVNFVDEDDARRMFFGILEHIAHPSRAHADKHFDKIRAGNREERHLRLARNRTRQQRFSGTRAAHHQHAARNASAELLKLGRIAQKLHQLCDFFFRLFTTRDIGERHRVIRLIKHARLALAEGERAAAPAALHLSHEEYPHPDQEQHREPRNEYLREEALLFVGLGFDDHTIFQEVGHQPDVRRRIGREFLAALLNALYRAAFDHDPLDAPLLHLVEKLGILHRLLRRFLRADLIEHGHQHQRDDQPDRNGFN